MMLIAIIYLACAAVVLTHLARAPLVEDDALPDDLTSDDGPSSKNKASDHRADRGPEVERTPAATLQPNVRREPRR